MRTIRFLAVFLPLMAAFTWSLAAQESGEPKRLAPGVMKTIRPFINYSETFQWSSMPQIMAEDASFDWAEDLYFSKQIWCLELSFKPIRLIEVDFPKENGKMERKKVWYMVYSVTNTGRFLESALVEPADNGQSVMVRAETGGVRPEKVPVRQNNLDGLYEPKLIDYLDAKPDENGVKPGRIRFSPRFLLAAPNIAGRFNFKKDDTGKELGDENIQGDFFQLREMKPGQGLYFSEPLRRESVVYSDQFLPLAHIKIAAREDANQQFENTVTIPSLEIEPGQTVWGIATWTDLDPRIDRFTVYISGLTNALRWEDTDEAFERNAAPMTGRDIFRKTLKLNFYRPGDEFDESEEDFHYGIPGEPDFEWIYL